MSLTIGGVLSTMTPLLSKVAINPAPLTTQRRTIYLAPTCSDKFSSLWSLAVASCREAHVPLVPVEVINFVGVINQFWTLQLHTV